MQEIVEGAITVSPMVQPLQGFDQYFNQLTPENNLLDPWFPEYWEEKFQCRLPEFQVTCQTFSAKWGYETTSRTMCWTCARVKKCARNMNKFKTQQGKWWTWNLLARARPTMRQRVRLRSSSSACKVLEVFGQSVVSGCMPVTTYFRNNFQLRLFTLSTIASFRNMQNERSRVTLIINV